MRHCGKIEAAINNARHAVTLIEAEGSLAAYLWRHEPAPMDAPANWSELGARSIRPEAAAASKDLKKRGWRFVGPTTMTALFQAAGLVNDHIEGCICRAPVEVARAAFVRPG